MEILLANSAGFCFGVKRAVKLANENASDNTYAYGELVHNKDVVQELAAKGVKQYNKNIRNKKIIIRSHGVHKNILKDLINDENEIIDCVCPKVKYVYTIVEKYKEDRQIIIVGKKDHPEVIGINSYCDDKGIIIENLDDIKNIEIKPSIIVSQTTNEQNFFKNVTNIIKAILKDDVLVYNTICSATKVRQDEVKNLAKEVDAMIVLGGVNSSNTKKLAIVAKEYLDNVYLVENIHQVDLDELKKFNKIGITAGASTPDSVIKEAVSSMENFDNNEMMEAIENSFKRVRRGEIVEGEVLYVTDNEIMVNIGYRSDGIVSREELSSNPDVKPSDLFKPGDTIQVYVVKIDDGDGNVVLSHKRVEAMKVWDEFEQKFENKENVVAHVKNVVKGGLTADVDGLKAFIPASHVAMRFQRDLNKFVGQDLECEIIDFDKAKRRIVLSRKNIEEKQFEDTRKEVFSKLHEGDVIEGTVQRLTDFGAFVDVGGVDGLIHISEMSWNRIKHPSEVVAPGENVEVQILNLDEEKNRIALGLKQTTKRPWDEFVSSVEVGDTVIGHVVNLLDFGAFVRLESGVDGLLHVSQISRDHIEKPADILNIGDEVTVKVTDIDEENKKISLSIKALLPEPEKKEEKPRVKKERPKKEFKPEIIEPKQDEFNTTIGDLIDIDLDNLGE
ncbi:bifunctional 4-hydroxy-3-methylbut-2-enyl diphosphate reductase/30S ribosomal protein S1 [Peptoniphilus sp. BV3AC2]|uniref:bifunctional 4-hydroxy-3-methylbut-2-enyl diphosphate reductase/30S ribosomal protein S1 n=1 Tax=Peptoniphilus sp. BV3AC2 TaxID=1111133 RepID=UPI0003B8C596|nr:bifunctional 4-hydroxy-3-methylbut-2-enyl diphosphate reductase/30S ribosomal protein S1 [Peptoniphilus sp. BV3AC2]ERT63415.1 4-hydroxy-3-methylbut-2-enyl diphosphate reductase [Peptoniphilus sp. BV3AC2]